MKKWFNNFFFSGTLTWMTYCVISFVLQEVLVHHSGSKIILEVYTDEDAQLDFTLNVPPGIDGAYIYNKNLKTGLNRIELPFSGEEYINSIYIKPKKSSTFYLDSIYVTESYKEIALCKDEYIQHLRNKTGKDNEFELVKNKGIKIEIDDTNPILVLTDKITDAIYLKQNSSINLVAKIISVFGFLILIIVFIFYSTKMPIISLKLNFCTLFLVLLFTPMFSQKENKTTENRTLAPFPDLNVNIWRIPSKFDRYYNDHFPYRNLLNKTFYYLKIKLFNVSPVPDFSQIGKEGWLFYSTPRVKDVYRGTKQFTNEELELIKLKLEARTRNLGKKGVDFYLMIPPLKHSIYPEFIPDAIKKIEGKYTKREQVLNYLREKKSFVQIIDPFPVLMGLKDTMETYYKTDTHWNKLAAFRVYQHTINILNKKHPSIGNPSKIKDFEVSITYLGNGDLIMLMNADDLMQRKVYDLIPKGNRKSGHSRVGENVKGENGYIFYQSDSLKDKPRLLMYRDSYTSYLHPFMAENFSYSGYSWTREFNMERVDKDKPDILIYEMMERFMDDLLIY